MSEIIYSIVVFLATCIGAISGIGGGVIIKPSFDTLNIHSVETISFFSGCAVLTMSLYSTSKHIRNKELKLSNSSMLLYVIIGSILGGFIGSNLFKFFLTIVSNDIMKGIQACILVLILLFVLANTIFEFKKFHINNKLVILLVGLFLGTISSFIGIGGGPLNVAVFILFFSCTIKQAAVYSLITIVFSQITSLLLAVLTTSILSQDLNILFFILPAALLGGIIGTKIHKQVNEKVIEYVYNMVIILILLLNVINAYHAFV